MARNHDRARAFAVIGCLSTMVVLATIADAAEVSRTPNIVMVLADDLGYADLGCYGQTKIKTPHVDRMAAEGMRFVQYYAGASVCAPSRCVLMTGKHGGHCRVRGNASLVERAKQTLAANDVTVAALLKQAGYATALVGKWGLGMDDMPGQPLRQGFDFFFGYLDQVHAHNYFADYLWRNAEKVTLPNAVRSISVGKRGEWGTGGIATKRVAYSPQLMLDEGLRFIEQNRSRPFFLYFATTIPHANNEAAKETGNGAEVPDLGIYRDRPWPAPEKGYAAMITYLDTQVGAILERLQQLGLDDQTLVIFTSDNGAESKPSAGYDTTFFRSGGELRGFKRDNYEGGIRAPFIARWPGKIKAGSVSQHVGYFGDFLATATELARTKTPTGLDSISFLPALLGHPRQQQRHEWLYWEYNTNRATSQGVLLDGRWKGVRNERHTAPLELYDLHADVAEARNIASRHPDIVAKMEAYLRTAREDATNWPLRGAPAKKSP
jgi:arylsulfatase A-like enzyme